MTNHQPLDPATDETSQADRIRRLEHRCDMEAAHLREMKAQVCALIATAGHIGVRNQQMERDIETLKAERDLILRERDEARREVLLWVKERCSWAELAQEIKKRGWEYLKENYK